MDDVLNSKLENISELGAEELSALKDEIVSKFQELDSQDRTRESVEAMTTLADAMTALKDEEGRRAVEAEELEALAQKASDVIGGSSDEDAETEEVTTEDEAATDPAIDEEIVAEEEEAPVEEEIPAEDAPEDVPTDEVEVPAEDDTEEEEVEVKTDFASEDAETEDASEEDSDNGKLSVDEAPEAELSAETIEVEATELSAEVETEAELANETEDETSEDASELSVEANNTESDVSVASDVNTQFSAPAENAPAETPVEAKKTATIVAAADVRGVQSGSVLPNRRALAQALLERRNSMKRTTGGDGEQAMVASIKHDDFYSESQILDSNDTEGNRSKVDALVASIKSGETEALVAAGGLYGPVDTSWDIYELGETLGRPVKDSLPSFKADRGGLRFMTPPVLADLDGAVSVWTLQDDIEAAQTGSDKEKPCIRVNAGEEVTVYLEAQPLCLTFGNIGARAYPELVERHIQLAQVQHARFAEQRLLTRIGTLSTKVTAAAQLGAARDILVQVDQVAAAMRNRHRLDPEAPLRAIFPVWFKNALRSDLVKQLPGDGQDAALSLADATITRWFAERKVTVTWALDSESSQYFGEQADGALVNYPSTVVWYLFPEGTFLFLEEATLDLGIVRDSTLNATNDYKMFVESFENVAKVGVESLRIESGLKIAGASAGTVNTLA